MPTISNAFILLNYRLHKLPPQEPHPPLQPSLFSRLPLAKALGSAPEVKIMRHKNSAGVGFALLWVLAVSSSLSSCCYRYCVCCCCRVEPVNEYYDGERDNDRDDAAVDVWNKWTVATSLVVNCGLSSFITLSIHSHALFLGRIAVTVAYCYRRSSVVSRTLCLSVGHLW